MEAVAAGRRLAGRYVVEDLIATGGMATVWRARDEVLARPVALKCLRDELARDPAFFERFNREAVASARLTHPSIVSVYDTGIDDSVSFIVMEFFEGRTLRALMDQDGPQDAPRATGIMVPVLSALEFAHSQGFIHRDVKPANILVDPADRVKVTDFGIAKAAFTGGDLTTTGAVLGTVRYLSPEQVQGSEVDARSDLYSAGVVLYELLTGRAPFEAEGEVATAMMRLTTEPEPPRSIRAGIPEAMESVVLRAMARRREERFQTAASMREALERAVAGGPPTVQFAPPVSRAEPTLALDRSAIPGAGLTSVESPLELEQLEQAEQVEAAGPAPPPSAPRRRRRSLVPVLAVLMAVAVVGAAAFVVMDLMRDEGGRKQRQAKTQGVEVAIAEARDFDPPPGDGSEGSDETRLAIDGKGDTAWTTERYETAQFGQLKEGVGLWIGFEREATIQRVTISSPIEGWTFQLKPAPSPDSPGDPLSGLSGATSFTAHRSQPVVVELDGVATSGLMIWVTGLGPAGGGFAAAIGEVVVTGSGG